MACCIGNLSEATTVELNGSAWETITLQRRTDYKNREFIVHKPSGTLYLKEPQSLTAQKAGAIAVGVIPYAAIVMVGNLIRIVVDICKIAFNTFKDFGRKWREEGAVAAISSIFYAPIQMTLDVAKDIWGIVRAPFFALGMSFGGLVGVFAPQEGRRIIGEVESAWHDGKGYKDDVRFRRGDCDLNTQECSDCMDEFWGGFLALFSKSVYFLGWCMQPRGNLNETVSGLGKKWLLRNSI